MIRPAEPGDLPHLPALQIAAGGLFRGIGMADIADNAPRSPRALTEYQRDGRAWVVPGAAFVVVELVDGCAHVEQVSVHPDAAGRGWGRRLIDHVAGWAADRGLPALTLTTFREVPWNAPYYRRLGFTEIPPASLTPGLRRVLADEAAFGLDPSTRVAMRRSLIRA